MSKTGTPKKAKPAAKAKASAKPKATGAKRNGPSLSPHLVVRGAAEAIAFYKKAFGAVETIRMPTSNGKLIHAALQINGGTVMLVDEMPEHGALSPLSLKGTPVTMHLNVDNVDAAFARAVKAGASVRMPVADMFWGDRYGIITDPFGHQWSIATHQRDMSAAEIKKAMKGMGQPGAKG